MKQFMRTRAFKHAIISLGIILLGFFILFACCNWSSKGQQAYTFDADHLESEQSGIGLSAIVPEGKSWIDNRNHAGQPFGYEYDFVVRNAGEKRIEDWNVEVNFDNPVFIDSSWNGDFMTNDRILSFYPDENVVTIDPGAESSFGAVIYSKQKLSVESCTVYATIPVRMTDSPVFFILWILSILWCIFFFAALAAYLRTESFLTKQKRDKAIIEQSIVTFANFIDAKDPNTRGHSVRVAVYARELARRMGLPEEQVEDIYYVALLHDCGKIGIPDNILMKKGKLTDEEYEIIKTHPTKGYEMLANFTAINNIREGAHYHHERFDGKGYPSGLIGSAIPLYARIIGVADSFDAMSSKREYRDPFAAEKILFELTSNAGSQFDPTIVPIMIGMIEDGFTEKVIAEYKAGNM